MSYTDETVYRLRDIIDEYTKVALDYRQEEERKEQLLDLAHKNKLTPTKMMRLSDSKPSSTDVESADKVIVFMEECIYDYKEKRKMLSDIQKENAWIEEYLKQNNIETSGLFKNFP